MIQTYKILHNIDIVDKDKLFTTAQYQATRGHPYNKTEFTGKYFQ